MKQLFSEFAANLSDRQLLRLARTAYERGLHRVYQAVALERFQRHNSFHH